jgi:hypothetical protein
MKILRLTRDIQDEAATSGRLEVLDAAGTVQLTLYSIEKPWLPSRAGGKAGEPFRSCVGKGVYKLAPYVRPSGDKVWRLTNPELDVYPLDTDIPAEKKAFGRFLVLIHTANYARDVVGCIGPGLGRTTVNGVRMVTQSRDAMKRLHQKLDGKKNLEIEIL